MPDGTLGAAVRVPDPVNISGYTSTQPTIGRVDGLNKTILFFTSDRPGGVGKEDIWYVEVNGNSYGTPINAKDLNTIDAEATPFFHQNSQTLYFSSFGLKGFGGYSIR